MTLNYYAISFEPTRMVANEIQAKEAAVLLDAGHSILLGTPVDLVRVALRQHKSLKIFARSDVLRASRPRPPRRSAARARSQSAVSAGGILGSRCCCSTIVLGEALPTTPFPVYHAMFVFRAAPRSWSSGAGCPTRGSAAQSGFPQPLKAICPLFPLCPDTVAYFGRSLISGQHPPFPAQFARLATNWLRGGQQRSRRWRSVPCC